MDRDTYPRKWGLGPRASMKKKLGGDSMVMGLAAATEPANTEAVAAEERRKEEKHKDGENGEGQKRKLEAIDGSPGRQMLLRK
ncbi:H/ACA ribonucleoprotein complex subunit 4 [Camellia lanceoleosa]|uniref:H/ACA ribonucleoprotein complex subunit 4 n=1 Tax=Camellia lanceoleosa TaxID=1840588 RepID=A0ACC0HRU5_9ERIC|nr:H/ACA ribonucleoprotein complex subunit 4 [Camellia lanceoleosa]